MRDWRKFWRDRSSSCEDSLEAALREVGKTVLGNPVPKSQIDLIAENIRRQLNLGTSHRVIDIGCGNGLLTGRLASYVSEIYGFDISESLIQAAQRRYNIGNCYFFVGDVATVNLSNFFSEPPSKLFAYEILQHLSFAETEELFAKIRNSAPHLDGLFVGSIPDFDLIKNFYNTPARWKLYESNRRQNKEQIGHWWKRTELAELCSSLHLKCTFLEQDPNLYTAHYRFDMLVHD